MFYGLYEGTYTIYRNKKPGHICLYSHCLDYFYDYLSFSEIKGISSGNLRIRKSDQWNQNTAITI